MTTESIRRYINRIRINNYLNLAFLLGILQFIVYFSGYDHLLTIGPFVTHHFIELPAFGIFGYGFSILLHEMKLSPSQTHGINLFCYFITVTPIFGGGIKTMLASFLVSFLWLIGFYYHRIIFTKK